MRSQPWTRKNSLGEHETRKNRIGDSPTKITSLVDFPLAMACFIKMRLGNDLKVSFSARDPSSNNNQKPCVTKGVFLSSYLVLKISSKFIVRDGIFWQIGD